MCLIKMFLDKYIRPYFEWTECYQRKNTGEIFKKDHRMDTVFVFDQVFNKNTLRPVKISKLTDEIKESIVDKNTQKRIDMQINKMIVKETNDRIDIIDKRMKKKAR